MSSLLRTFRLAWLMLSFGAATLGGALAQQEAEPPPSAPVPKSIVYSATERDSIEGFTENPAVTRRMVDSLVLAVTHEHDLAKAWRSLVSPTDRVGIKVSTTGRRYFSSHKGVVAEIVSGLEAAGIPRSKVVVWDRLSGNLRAAGFVETPGGYMVHAIDPPQGFDQKTKVIAPMFGRLIWGDPLFHGKPNELSKISFDNEQLSAESHFATILSREVTKIINVAVFSDEAGCGVAGALYNVTVPNVDNNRRFTQPGGASSIVDLYGNSQIGPKVVLNILDGLVAQYAGGPGFNPNYAFHHCTLYASKDPVAHRRHSLAADGRVAQGSAAPADRGPCGLAGGGANDGARAIRRERHRGAADRGGAMSLPENLGGPVLRSVSRSFYLTIRVLPEELRAPIGLAYLLARASDTIADSASAPAEVRLGHLAAFGQMIGTGSKEGLALLRREITSPEAGEQTLIEQLPACIDALAKLDEPARKEIAAVMEKIIRGQSLDLGRFPAQAEGRVVALENAEQLEEYTYLVAGCVGEFWTRLCFQRLPRYSACDPAELCRIGVNYGKGLQLVNILRDLPADLRSGRCYLPADELQRAGASPQTLLEKPASARSVFGRWHERATALLEDGRRYIAALRPARLRIGCFLPWYLGVKTLDLLAAVPPLEAPGRVKVPRSTIRRALGLAPVVALTNAPLRGEGLDK